MMRKREFFVVALLGAVTTTAVNQLFVRERAVAARALAEAPSRDDGTSWSQLVTNEVALELLQHCGVNTSCQKHSAESLVIARSPVGLSEVEVQRLAAVAVVKSEPDSTSAR